MWILCFQFFRFYYLIKVSYSTVSLFCIQVIKYLINISIILVFCSKWIINGKNEKCAVTNYNYLYILAILTLLTNISNQTQWNLKWNEINLPFLWIMGEKNVIIRKKNMAWLLNTWIFRENATDRSMMAAISFSIIRIPTQIKLYVHTTKIHMNLLICMSILFNIHWTNKGVFIYKYL